MRLIALLPGPAASGGDTTMRRIAAHLSALGHSVALVPLAGDLAETARELEVEAMIGTHALLSGERFLAADLPFVLVFGGTDLNEFAFDEDALAVMGEAARRAVGLVAFNEDFVARCLALWPDVAHKLHQVPQAVQTSPSPGFSLWSALGLSREARVFVLPAGLRPVKDPLFLVDCVHEWHRADPRVELVIVGTTYDGEYRELVSRRCARAAGVRLVDPLPRGDLHALMRQATAVLNTSISECSPNAVLEAMDLGACLLVRDIPGNTCLVEHGVTGLAFSSPAEFRRRAEVILDDEVTRRRLGRRATEFVRERHGMAAERAGYAGIVAALEQAA